MCFQLCFRPPSVFKKREENEALTCIHVLLQATDTRISSGALVDVCMCVCSYTSVWEDVQGRKQELDPLRNHLGLSWCEEAGSELGCSKMPKWTISHRPWGLVLIDAGWTGVGGLLVKYMLTWMTYCILSLPKCIKRGPDAIRLDFRLTWFSDYINQYDIWQYFVQLVAVLNLWRRLYPCKVIMGKCTRYSCLHTQTVMFDDVMLYTKANWWQDFSMYVSITFLLILVLMSRRKRHIGWHLKIWPRCIKVELLRSNSSRLEVTCREC